MGEAARTKRIHANVSHRIEGRIFNQNEFFRLLFVCRLFPIPVPRKPYFFFFLSLSFFQKRGLYTGGTMNFPYSRKKIIERNEYFVSRIVLIERFYRNANAFSNNLEQLTS